MLTQAADQIRDGAEILDVNAGVPGIDEKSVIVNIVKALQGITDAPLQIDSGDPEVIEAALRVLQRQSNCKFCQRRREILDFDSAFS